MRWQQRIARGEEGTSLVLALAFMALFGVSAGLLAQFGAVSFKTTAAVRDQRASVYAAEGAVDTAIDYVRGSPTLGKNGGTCLAAGSALSFPAAAGHSISATCVGQAPSNGGVSATLPSNALLTLASGGEDGITTIGGTVRTSGSVFSNSDVSGFFGNVDAGPSPLTARGSCAPGTAAGTPLTCNVGSGGHPEGDDPNYPSPLATLPAHQTVPACPASGNKVIPFAPGFYDDNAGLNNLTNGGCHNAILWFQPGSYYFDFDWSVADTSNNWTLNDPTINVVGGTPKGWSTTAPSRPTIPSPGACKTDTDAAPNNGVQWVFGGDSNITGWSANIELCATPDANGRELAIYGQKTGSLTPTSATLEPTPGGPGATGITGWTSPLSPSNAVDAIDNTVTSRAITGNSKKATITTRGYTTTLGSATNPADFGSATIKIQHSESAPTTNVASLTATVSGPGGTCSNIPVPIHSGLTTDVLSNLSGCINDFSDISGVTVTYTATLKSIGNPTATLAIDGIEIVVNYTPPAVRAQSGCVTIPTGQSGACDLVLLTSSFSGSFYVNGTVYAPLARMTLELGGILGGSSTRVQLNRGVILRSVIFVDGSWGSWNQPTASVPPSMREVVFTGTVDSVRRVRAVVDYTDTPTIGTTADVVSWSVTG